MKETLAQVRKETPWTYEMLGAELGVSLAYTGVKTAEFLPEAAVLSTVVGIPIEFGIWLSGKKTLGQRIAGLYSESEYFKEVKQAAGPVAITLSLVPYAILVGAIIKLVVEKIKNKRKKSKPNLQASWMP